MQLLTPTNKFDEFLSHPGKPLRLHMQGVLEGVKLRTSSTSCAAVAEIAALFHDLGKLNPNFQAKVNPASSENKHSYSSHAYLSALTFLYYYKNNNASIQEVLGLENTDFWRVIALIAHHHGHLPNFDELLSNHEQKKVLSFLKKEPQIFISDFLQQWIKHKYFDLCDPSGFYWFERSKLTNLDRQQRERFIEHRLDYFQETQFAFASLLEADKRDAGDNKYFHRTEQIEWAKRHFDNCLQKYFYGLQSSSKSQSPLNRVRTQIRHEAVASIKERLQAGERIFSLTAPTGAGKTLTLLALASAIREQAPDHSIIYGLPFLTITEQVEEICQEIFDTKENLFVTRNDSRANNPKLEKLLSEIDNFSTEDNKDLQKLLQEAFSSETFDAAFTITTFVQIFETLLSNRNATLLKLPNFAKTIFLLDEIQSLPPRLYVFFAAYLQAFCEKFDSYAIFSTATMPVFEITEAASSAKILFHQYKPPQKDLTNSAYFQNPVFDRYEVRPLQQSPITREKLAQVIINQDSSALVVLNTIKDSRELFSLLKDEADAKVLLLNTHFTLRDRRRIVGECKELLKINERVILISTQLIEAGVDIDFPMVFRDLCPLPSLIQTAGRGNRNGKNPRAKIWFFELTVNDKSRAKLIYSSEPSWFLDFSRQEVLATDGFKESELLLLQKKYFSAICHNLKLGDAPLKIESRYQKANLVDEIDKLAHETVGSFRLINEEDFGKAVQYFVPQFEDQEKDRFEDLQNLIREMAGRKISYEEYAVHRIKVEAQLRELALDIVQFRVPYGKNPPAFAMECCGIRHLSMPDDYSSERGIIFDGAASAFL